MKNTIPAESAHLPEGTAILKFVSHPDYDEYFITFEHPERKCPYCDSSYCTIRDSHYTQTVRHIPLGLLPRLLTFDKIRYGCRDCGSTFFEQPPWLHESLHMTTELYLRIYFDLTDMVSISSIAKKNCVPEAVIRDVLDHIRCPKPAILPETLCIDEFSGDAGSFQPDRKRWCHTRYQCCIVNGDAGTCIDVLPDYHADAVCRYFSGFSKEQRTLVRYVCCDMHNGFVNAAKKCFPDAVVVVDKFHVVKRLHKALDDVRKRLQASSGGVVISESDTNKLKELARDLKTKISNQDEYWEGRKDRRCKRILAALEAFPELKEAYEMLQEFYVLNDSTDNFFLQRADLTDWIQKYDTSGVPEIAAAAGSIRYWRKYIEYAWQYNRSNGPCEGINNKIKTIKRISFGVHDFENFRKRIMLICGPNRIDYGSMSSRMPKRHVKGGKTNA